MKPGADEMKRERRRGMRIMLAIIIAFTLTCCDIKVAEVTVWRSPVSQLDDFLREYRSREEPGR